MPMKRFLTRSVLALAIAAGGFYSVAHAATSTAPTINWEKLQPDRNEAIASVNVIELLRRHHYSKPPLDDARSSTILDSYLKTLDPARIYFTAEDISRFEQWRYQFDDFLKRGELRPGFSIYQRQLERAQEHLTFTLKKLDADFATLDFTKNETLEVDRDKTTWVANDAALHDLWQKRLKDEVLRLKITGKQPDAIRDLLVKRYTNQLKRMAQIRSEDIFQTYINAVTQTYDPHTNYLSPTNAENFDINMSLSLEGIGAILQTENEYVKIKELVTAGPADKTRQIHPADRIIGVAQGDKEMVDVIGWRLDEVVKLIRGPKGSTVRLEIIPANNAPNDMTSRVVQITREAVRLEEQAAKKNVLELEHEGRKYRLGIIKIPTFYLDFKAYRNGDPNYKSTTRDVRRLISELQSTGVDGILIDLRNNGGGSLQEANELTGLFIDKGPTVQVRNGDGAVDVLTDDDPGVAYKGPMAVLVNRLSASASEIFAGAMQDYNRALILGDQTFGKGTVQSIQPLNHGELKITLAKFYRVSGQSTQHQGVMPDIAYPATLDHKEIGESALPSAMPWDRIAPAVRLPDSPFAPYINELRAKHDARAAKNPDFIFAQQSLILSQQLAKDTLLSLNEHQRRIQQQANEARQLELENARRVAKGETPLTALKQNTTNDDEDATDNDAESTANNPSKDAFLSESGHILADYLTLKTGAVARQ